MRRLFSIAILAFAVSFWWRRRAVLEDSEVITTPYINLPNDFRLEIDKLYNGYDPRRYGIEVLEYIEEKGAPVPFIWEDVVDRDNKTDLGLYYMDQFNVTQVVLLKEQLHHFPTIPSSIPQIDTNSSISTTIQDFFYNEVPNVANFTSKQLTNQDFKFTKPGPHSSTDPRHRYFKEGSLLKLPNLAHYDVRFYHSKLAPLDRLAILHRIVRSWFRFTNLAEMDTWLAHGSLLGWFFNGLIMPWDDDLDVQMSARAFEKLVKYNGTVVVDYNEQETLGKYLIDVNPWYGVREKESDNKIDARFIDVESGLYIDITVLSVGDVDREKIEEESAKLTEMYKVFNPGFDQILTETEKYVEEIQSGFNKSLETEELVFCKDYHFYKVDELGPLIPVIFEGGVGYVPAQIQNLLQREYKRKSLYLFEYKGFQFDKIRRIWKHNSIEYEYNDQMSEFIKLHEETRQATIKRQSFNSLQLIHFNEFRMEPWIRQLYNSQYYIKSH